MSGIAAIFRFDGAPADPTAVEAMTETLAYRGVDGIARWSGGGAAMAHLMLHTTAESLEETQPLANEDGSLVLAMDGWLANWEELRADLLARGARLRTRSDAELVLRAYEQWGDDCPRHIDGEFAFVVWDVRRQEAFCARDHVAMRPLHYHWDGRRLVVASDIAAVLAGPGVEARPNRGMIAEIMTNEWLVANETVWEEIHTVPHAHWMRFGKGGVRSGEYWSPPLEVTLTYPRDEDYFDHYRELLTDCVRRYSRSHLPVAIDVSGGLDSSAVFSVADRLLAAGRLPAPDIRGYTYKFDYETEANELEYARAVAAHVGRPVREVDPFLPDLEWFDARRRADRDMAPYPNSAMVVGTGRALVADGCRILLNGEGGDEYLAGKRFYFAEQIAAGDWAALLRSAREDAAELGYGRTLWSLFRHGFGYFLPRPLLELRHRLTDPKGPNAFDGAFWLSREMEELLVQRRRAVDPRAVRNIRNIARRSMNMTRQMTMNDLLNNASSRLNAQHGFEMRSPMMARSFIEFAFATPERIRLRGNIHKFAHRQAMTGLLPAKVAQRNTKADFSVAFANRLDRMNPLFTEMARRDEGRHLNGPGLTRLYDRYLETGDEGGWELWGVYSCERLIGSDATNRSVEQAE